MWRIANRLYLGDNLDANDLQLLESVQITHVVNCAAGLPCRFRRRFKYLHLKFTDPDPEFQDYIEQFCRWIDAARRKGGVLVHCMAGLSRSPSVILAYLCHKGLTMDQAMKRLRRGVGETEQGFIEPDHSFLEQIEDFFEDRD